MSQSAYSEETERSVSSSNKKTPELSNNQKQLIHMIASLPIHQMIAGRFTIAYKQTDEGNHNIKFVPEFGEAKQELELFLSRIDSLKVDGISHNDMVLTAKDMDDFEHLVESYIEHNPVQISDEKIGEITHSYLVYKGDKLEKIKQELTEQNNGEPFELNFTQGTPYPRTTYALYRGFETILAHYGHEVNRFSHPENVYSTAWNITEDESNFFIFIDSIEGEDVNAFQGRAITFQDNLLHMAQPSVTMTCAHLAEHNQFRIQITSADISDIKDIIKAYYDTQMSKEPESNKALSYLQTSFHHDSPSEILTAEELLSLPSKPVLTARSLDITPQPITIKEIEGIISSEVGHNLEDSNTYNPQFNVH